MLDHVLFPLVVAVAIGFGVDRREDGGPLLWWPPSTWEAPSRQATRLALIAFAAGVAASFCPWWVVLPLVALGFTVGWLRQRRRQPA